MKNTPYIAIIVATGIFVFSVIMGWSAASNFREIWQNAEINQTTESTEPVLPTRFVIIGKEHPEGMDRWIYIYRDTFTGQEFVKYENHFVPISN